MVVCVCVCPGVSYLVSVSHLHDHAESGIADNRVKAFIRAKQPDATLLSLSLTPPPANPLQDDDQHSCLPLLLLPLPPSPLPPPLVRASSARRQVSPEAGPVQPWVPGARRLIPGGRIGHAARGRKAPFLTTSRLRDAPYIEMGQPYPRPYVYTCVCVCVCVCVCGVAVRLVYKENRNAWAGRAGAPWTRMPTRRCLC